MRSAIDNNCPTTFLQHSDAKRQKAIQGTHHSFHRRTYDSSPSCRKQKINIKLTTTSTTTTTTSTTRHIERQMKIDRENRMLLDKLARIVNRKPKVDKTPGPPVRKINPYEEKRDKEGKRVERENMVGYELVWWRW